MTTEIIINSSVKGEILLNGIPFWAYIVQSIEKLGLKNISIVLSGDLVLQKDTIQDYTKKKLETISNSQNTKKIFINASYPLLTEKYWEQLLQTEQPLLLVTQKQEIIAEVKLNNKEKPIVVEVNEKEVSLNIEQESERVMAEAIINANIFKVHPVRYSPPYKIEHGGIKGKTKLLFSAPYSFLPKETLSLFNTSFEVTFAFNAPYTITESLLSDVEIWLTGTCPPYFIDKNLLSNGKNLKLIATPSTGTNHIDVEGANDLGIKICSIKTADFLSNIHASSEHTFALLLAMVKKVPLVSNESKMGVWREKEDVFRSIELFGRTIGIIGYGRIGRNLARYCNVFGMKIIAYDPYKVIDDDFTQQVGSKEELLAKSEIVSVNYHLTPENKGTFTQKDFENMKPGSYFLNTARGELVDEKAMIESLKNGKLKAAAVDVITHESELYKWNHPVIEYARNNDNLIVTPHTAGLTVDSESKAAIEIFKEIQKAINNES